MSEEIITVDITSQHIVINQDRSVAVPSLIKKSIVQRDHNIERLTFDCPRYWYGKDISTLNIYVNYISVSQKAKGDDPGSSLCENVVIDENDQDMMHFDWVITNNVSQDVGGLLFLVCAKSVDSDGNEDVHWNSHLCKDLEVQEGLEASDSIVKKYPDVIEQIFQRLDNVDGASPEQIAAAVEEYLIGNPIKVPKNLSDLNEDSTHRTVSDAEKERWNKAEENVQPDWNETDDTKDSYVKNKPESLKNPQKLTFAGAVTAEYDGSGAVTVTIPEGSGGSGGTVRIEKLSTDTSVELEPNKLYVFPEMADMSIMLAEPSDTSIVSEYHFVFQSGATSTTLSLPDTIKIPSGFTVDANKIYEISIMEGCLCAQNWGVTA